MKIEFPKDFTEDVPESNRWFANKDTNRNVSVIPYHNPVGDRIWEMWDRDNHLEPVSCLSTTDINQYLCS